MHDAFGYTLDEYIYFGGYPGPDALIRDERRWRRYVKDSLVTPAIAVRPGALGIVISLNALSTACQHFPQSHPLRFVGKGGEEAKLSLTKAFCIEGLLHQLMASGDHLLWGVGNVAEGI